MVIVQVFHGSVIAKADIPIRYHSKMSFIHNCYVRSAAPYHRLNVQGTVDYVRNVHFKISGSIQFGPVWKFGQASFFTITNVTSLAGALGEKMTTDVGDEQLLFQNSIDPTT